ncbi:helix-turn-helix domain-containing protein [Sneathiella sp. P13V-1]|uniref:AraC family transcriptional regulator n=1 Tax=Sneathiella sp. P13V-1 TaxID=2697366 RepID=UPI00187B7217|nr:AraC family transcriptional regulator [Sneathiella sp. P13V-1]MBE7638255.1 helix-turn-helix domain-containing protein [Sneathiella sp. P13V-1]
MLVSRGEDGGKIRRHLKHISPNRLERLRYLAGIAVKLTDDPCLAIDTGQLVSLASYGILGYSFMQSRSLEELYIQVKKNMWVLDPTEKNALKLSQPEGRYVISYENPPHWPEVPYFYIDLFFSALLHQSRELSRKNLDGAVLYLKRPAEHIPPTYSKKLGIEVIGNSETDLLILQKETVRETFPDTHLFHSPSFYSHCDVLLGGMKKESTLVEKVRHSLLGHSGRADLETIATEFGMSSRTMRRHLTTLGTSFRHIQKELLVHISKEYLANTPLSIADIAELIGYHDAPTYSRAFKQITGHTPAEFKKQKPAKE